MINLQKASLLANGNQVTLSMPISKIDVEKRIVSGFATLDNVDKQGDRVDSSASEKAFAGFRGNVRLMHQPIPAGKVVSFRTDTFFDPKTEKSYSGVYVDTYISKGAQDIWEMVMDGTLTGFSIGGNIKETDTEFDAELNKTVRIIKDYDLVELSLVDSPANQFANIFSIQKTLDGSVADGIFNKSHIQNVFWCENEEVAYLSTEETYSCNTCKSNLSSIGWIDEVEKEQISKSMMNLIQSFKKGDVITSEDTINRYPDQNRLKSKVKTNKAASSKYSTGDFVQWGSSGGTARGKITRVVNNGKINVPNSSVSVSGTPEDPAVVITVYRKEGNSWKPTQTKVGHKMKSLRSWAVNAKKALTPEKTDLLPNTVVEKAIESEVSVAIQKNEGGVYMTENPEVVEKTTDEILVDEVVEETTEETEAVTEVELEKSDDVEVSETVETSAEEESAEDASTDNGEATDLEKALNEIKNFVGDALTKSAEQSTDAMGTIASTVAEVTKSLTDKIVENDSRYEEVNKALAGIMEGLNELNKRVELVESDTAVKKSGEFDSSPETTIQKSNSVWGGRFLGSAQVLN